jgi:beta-phosphoglucomutase
MARHSSPTRPEANAVRETVAAWAARPRHAVIFDFNGTLSDDEGILEAIFNEVFAQHLGWCMTAEEYRTELLGLSDREIVERAVQAHGSGDSGVVEALLSLRTSLYAKAVTQHSPISADVTALVQRLSDAEVPVAIVTGAQRADVDAVLKGSVVGSLIPVVVTEEDVERGKPDPEGFLRGAALLHVDPSDVLVFEDSVPGIQAAARAGMACIAVVGEQPNGRVLEAAPCHIARLDSSVLDGTDG